MATKRITYGELENGMQVWLQGVLFTATEVEKRPTVPGMHETLRPEDHTRVTFKGIVVNDKSLKNTPYDGGTYGGYSWVLITIEEQSAPAPVEPARIAWMESILSNDESSTDYELGLFFIAHAVPEETAQEYIARRTDYLNSL
jgi:hypothetical protein